MGKELVFLFIVISLITFSIALPQDSSDSVTFTYQTNYSTLNVNNSQFFQGYTPTTLRTNYQSIFDDRYYEITDFTISDYYLKSNPNGYYNSTSNIGNWTLDKPNYAGLIDNSIVNTLHRHSELVASDGSPDPAVSVDSIGRVGIGTDSPQSKLHIDQQTNAISGTNIDVSELGFKIINPANDNGEAVGIGFGLSVNIPNVGAAIIHERVGSESYGNLHFATKPSGGAAGVDIPIRMTIDSAGNVGIGTVSPGAKSHIYDGSSGATPFAASTQIIESDDTNILQFLTPNNKITGIMFGDPESNYAGYIRYSHVDDSMKLSTDHTTKLTILSKLYS